jgi:DivIVA domain-containing protein
MTVPPLELPVGRFTADDVDGLHFSLGLRGYRMDEVDQVLDRVSSELRSRDVELARLRRQAAVRMTRDDEASVPAGADDDVDEDLDDDSVVASTEGSVAGFGERTADQTEADTTTADQAAAPDTRER